MASLGRLMSQEANRIAVKKESQHVQQPPGLVVSNHQQAGIQDEQVTKQYFIVAAAIACQERCDKLLPQGR